MLFVKLGSFRIMLVLKRTDAPGAFERGGKEKRKVQFPTFIVSG